MFGALHHKAIRPGSRADVLTLGDPPRPALILISFFSRPTSVSLMGKRRHAKKEEADARGQGMFRALHHKAIRPGSRADLRTLGNPRRPALILFHFSRARPQSHG